MLSINATGILGIGNALPINQNADSYHTLSAQSDALLSYAQLQPTMTLRDHQSFREALGTLIKHEGDHFPARVGHSAGNAGPDPEAKECNFGNRLNRHEHSNDSQRAPLRDMGFLGDNSRDKLRK